MNELNGSLRKRLRLCSYCGQTLPTIRLGIKLPPLKARIFDLIQRGGEDGVLVEDLLAILEMNRSTLRSHVQQINAAILDTGYRIYGRTGFFRLVNLWPLRRAAKAKAQKLRQQL